MRQDIAGINGLATDEIAFWRLKPLSGRKTRLDWHGSEREEAAAETRDPTRPARPDPLSFFSVIGP